MTLKANTLKVAVVVAAVIGQCDYVIHLRALLDAALALALLA